MVISEPAYLLLLLLIAAERVFELFISRRNARAAFAKGATEVGRRHYRVMVAMHTLFLASCAFESLVDVHADWPIVSVLALLGTFIAEFVRYAVVVTLGENWNTRIIVTPGAAPVTRGIYRWIRHPNYLAVILEIAALPLIRACWVSAIVFTIANAWILSIRIPAEESALGESYSATFNGVGRFLPHRRAPETRAQPRDASPN